jgi:hypothetical protein
VETVLSVLSTVGSTRRTLVVCYQRVSLSTNPGTAREGELPSHLYQGLVREALLAPVKQGVDVVLARDPGGDAAPAWLEDPTAGGHRPIVASALGPMASERFRHLPDGASQEWAMKGGLQVASAPWERGRPIAEANKRPPGLALAYFNIAPREQRFASLSGRESIWIDTPEGRRVSRLPSSEARAWAVDVSPAELVPVKLDTVILDVDGLEAILFWRGAIARAADAPPTRVRAELGVAPWDDPPHASDPEIELEPQPTQEIVIGKPDFRATAAALFTSQEPALPFVPTPPVAPSVAPPGRSASSAPAPVAPSQAPLASFAVESTVDAFPSLEEQEAELFDTQTTAPAALGSILPFRSAAAYVERPSQERVSERPGFRSAAVEPPRRNEPEPPFEPRHVAPPPPLAVLISTPPPAPPPQPQQDSEPQQEQAPRLALEEVAALDAELHRDATAGKQSLERKRVTEAELDAQRGAFLEAAALETKQGKRALQRSYDEAYLSRLEQLRGHPVSVDEYARIVVALERLAAPEVLVELDLPEPALLVLTRVFIDRTNQDSGLRKRIREQVLVARAG